MDKKILIENVINLILKDNEPFMDALILIGSFAREEEIFFKKAGKNTFISDIEFLIVAKHDAYDRLQKFNEHHIKDQLRKKGINIDVSIGVTTVRHLKRLKPYIFTLEVKKYGKVLWGDPNILSHIPGHTEKDINPQDAFILLNNRIVEQLILKKKILDNEEIPKYEIDKGYIQTVNSILGINQSYKSLYPEKKSAFLDLLDKNQDLKDLLSHFRSRILEAFDSVINYEPKLYSTEQALGEYKKLKDLYKNLYSYEKKAVYTPNIVESIKGWIKVVIRGQLSYFNLSDLICNLFTRSPQFLIYEQAANEYFSETQNPQKAEDIINKWKAVVK